MTPALDRARAARPGARRGHLRRRGTSRSTSPDVDAGYRAELEAAAAKAGTDESVLTGRGGSAAGRSRWSSTSSASSPARSAGPPPTGSPPPYAGPPPRACPLLASTASGGTRMQEGTPAFVRMVEISRALMDHRAAGLPYLVHLRHPTTGGVYASWGSLGHVTVAEPGALVGFLGPKVYEALNGRPFRPGRPGRGEPRRRRRHRRRRRRRGPARRWSTSPSAVLVDPPGPGRLPRRASRPAGRTDDRLGQRSSGTRRTDRVGRARPARPRRHGHDPAARHRRGRARLDRARRADPARRPAVRRRRPGPRPAGARARHGTGRPARGPARHAAGRGAGAAAASPSSTPRAPSCRRDAEERAIAGEIARCIATADHDDGADGLGDPRPGLRGRGAGPPARADGDRDRARLALAAAARGRERHRARRHRRTRPRWPSGSGCGPPTCWPTASCSTWCRRSTASRRRDLAVAVAAECRRSLREQVGGALAVGA